MKTLALVVLLMSGAFATTVIQNADGQRIEDDNGNVVIQNSKGSSIIQSTRGDNSPAISSYSSSSGKSLIIVNGKTISVDEDGNVMVDGKKCK